MSRKDYNSIAQVLLSGLGYEVASAAVQAIKGEIEPDDAAALQYEFDEACIEREICPECGSPLNTVAVVVGVHPWGSTTATEYGSNFTCPDCGWKEES